MPRQTNQTQPCPGPDTLIPMQIATLARPMQPAYRRLSPISTLQPVAKSPPFNYPTLSTKLPRRKYLQSNCHTPREHSPRNALNRAPPFCPKLSSQPPSNSHSNPYVRATRRRSFRRVEHPPSPPVSKQTLSLRTGRKPLLSTLRSSTRSGRFGTPRQLPVRVHYIL